MQIKGANGENYNVTSQGQGALNTVLGAVGTYGALQNGALGGILGGVGGGWNGNRPLEVITSDDRPISRYEAKMMQELAAKDGKIALLESNIYTDQKIADVYERLIRKIDANKEAQNEINMQQAVYNGTNTATIGCLKNEIAQLLALSEMVIPQRKVCDTCCRECNGN
jgi:hypothetical protein